MKIALTPEAVSALLVVFLPLVNDLRARIQATRGDSYMPTDEEMLAEFHANVTTGDAEADAWRARHPGGQ